MCSTRSLSYRVAAAFAAVVFVSGLAQSARAEVLYSQTFPNSAGNVGLNTANWFAYAGSGCLDASKDAGSYAAISFYIADDGTQGFPFTKPAAAAGSCSMIGTSDFKAIDITKYTGITCSWDQWDSDLTMKSQLAVEIGGKWYVNSQTFSTAAVYGVSGTTVTNGESKSLTLSSAAKWYEMTVTPGTAMSVGSTLVSLPTTGSLTAVGLYCTNAATSDNALCIDNFQVSGTAVPEPGTMSMLAAAMFSMLAYAWLKLKNR